LLWGLFPLYWPLLEPAGAVEILAHRIAWSLLVMLLVLAAQRHWRWIGHLVRHQRGQIALLSGAAAVIAVNWGTYIYGVNHNHVVETSLGYFINPLVTILLGVVVLHERLRWLQWVAVGVGFAAVVVYTVGFGRPPLIALVLAFSFGTYGLLKKKTTLRPVESLTVETGALFVPAVVFLVVLDVLGHGSFGHVAWHTSVLLAGTGVVTAVPLLAFAAAARRVPLVTIGLLQYLAPILQLTFGVLVFGEPLPPYRIAAFVLVWVAIVVASTDALRHRSPHPPAVPA